MSKPFTYELCNIDPDEISHVLVKIEKSFGIKFGRTELREVKTFGELSDIIINKVQGDNFNDCTTQQVFYKLRSAICEIRNLDKRKVITTTNLHDLLPKTIRKQTVRQIELKLGFKMNILRAKHGIITIMSICLLLSIVGIFLFWQAGLPALIFSIVGLNLANMLGNELDPLTVGQVAAKLSREHYLKSRRIPLTANKSEIVQKVKDLFMADLALENHQLSRESTFA